MPNAGDTRSIRKAGKRAAFLKRREQDDLKVVLSTQHGRRFLWRKLTEAKVFHASFHAESIRLSDFNEGRRSFGLELMAEIHALDPNLYLKMAQENMTDLHDEDELEDPTTIYAPSTHVVIDRQPEEDLHDA